VADPNEVNTVSKITESFEKVNFKEGSSFKISFLQEEVQTKSIENAESIKNLFKKVKFIVTNFDFCSFALNFDKNAAKIRF